MEHLSWLIGKTAKKSVCNLSFTWNWVPNYILLRHLFFPASLCAHTFLYISLDTAACCSLGCAQFCLVCTLSLMGQGTAIRNACFSYPPWL